MKYSCQLPMNKRIVLLHCDKVGSNLRQLLSYRLFGLNLGLQATLQIQDFHFVELLRSAVLPVLFLLMF